MKKKLTISISDEIYNGLHNVIGSGKISSFVEELVKPHVLPQSLEEGYKAASQDSQRETEALEWSENLLKDSYAR